MLGTPLKIEDGDTLICYQTLFYGLHKLSRRDKVSLKTKTGPGDMPCWHLISHLTLTMVTTTLWWTMVKSN